MLTPIEITQRANKAQVSPFVILRDYFQLLFLQYLTQSDLNNHFCFKGGTAIRFLFKGIRFSEDLDFTVMDLEPDLAVKEIELVTQKLAKEINVTCKTLKSIAGRSLRLTVNTSQHPRPISIKIDLSFREFILKPVASAINTDYPLVFSQLLYHYSATEIVAEKCRALMHRLKGRDLYDLWFLLSMQAGFDETLIAKKMAYYHETYSKPELLTKIAGFPKAIFITDLSPFIGKNERLNLSNLYDVIQTYLKQKLVSQNTI